MKSKKKVRLLLTIGLLFALLTSSIVFILNKKDSNPDKFIHISIDDTITVFKDITDNSDKYNSIFDNEMLNFFKLMHNKYGAVFSLYCYYEDGDFNLSQCTDKFADEFAENSNWLKIGFHNLSGEGNLSDAKGEEAENDYQKVITQLIRITGSENCIDKIIRLQNFSGNKEAIDAINNTENGIIGLLTADDDRLSYYLDETRNTYIDKHDTLEDDNLYFVSTDLRLENTWNPYGDLVSISKDENQNKVIEVFTHEWQMGIKMKLKIYVTCFFAEKYGYVWDYPMNR